jgi:hypothetical protein
MMSQPGRIAPSKLAIMGVAAVVACGGQTIASNDAGAGDETPTHQDAAPETGDGEDSGCGKVPYPGVECGKPCTIPGYSCSPGGPGDPIGWGCRVEPGASGPTWFCSEG